MSEFNPYTPPLARSETPEISTPSPVSGLALSFSLFWRIIVFQFVLLMAVLLPLKSVGILIPPIYSLIILAACLAISLRLSKLGLFHLVWVRRLNQSPVFVRRFSWALCGAYLLLALVQTTLFYTAPLVAWVKYKSLISFSVILGLCLVAPHLMQGPNNSSKTDSLRL